MGNVASNKSNGCLKKAFVGVGCGCVYPFFALLIILAISWYSLANAMTMIAKPAPINYPKPQQKDFWSLDEKLSALKKNSNFQSLNLNESEVNAYLSFFTFKPFGGFCLNKVRFSSENEKITINLIGSGYFMKSLIIKIYFNKFVVSDVLINSWKIPEKGLIRSKILQEIKTCFTINGISIQNLSKAKVLIDLKQDVLQISKPKKFFSMIEQKHSQHSLAKTQ